MKNLMPILALLVSLTLYGESAATNVTISLDLRTNAVHWDNTHTFITFMCKATIDNQTRDDLTLSNAFQDHASLSLKVTDEKGAELSRLYAAPFHFESFVIHRNNKEVFYPYYGLVPRFAPPANHTNLRLQLEGHLIGSGYSRPLTSSIVELKIPK